jgi:hypothetical protein
MRAARVLLVASLSLVVAAASASCTGERVRGSGKVVTKDVAVPSFTRLQVWWGFAVTVRRVSSVSNATLQATVTAPSLAQLQGSGASRVQPDAEGVAVDADVEIAIEVVVDTELQRRLADRHRLQDRLSGDQLRVELSGASRLDGPVDLRSATATLSGASQAELSGRAGSVNASASGASHLILQQLQVDALEVSLSGASDAEVSVRRTISANLSGASSLRYRGSPTFTRQDVSGGSSVTRVA